MAQVVRRQSLKADAWIRYENILSWMCGGHNEVLQYVFDTLPQFCPVSIIPHALYTYLHPLSLVPEEQTASVWKY
jgi:hypothetical protein